MKMLIPLLALPLLLASGRGVPQEPAPAAEPWVAACAVFNIDSYRETCERDYRHAHGIFRCDLDGAAWEKRWKTDAMTDRKQCSVTPVISSNPADGGLAAFVINGRLSFSVLGDAYPGTRQSIRVDTRAPHTLDDALLGVGAKALLNELRSGTIVKTRYLDWPYNVNNDAQFAICELPKLIDDCIAGRE